MPGWSKITTSPAVSNTEMGKAMKTSVVTVRRAFAIEASGSGGGGAGAMEHLQACEPSRDRYVSPILLAQQDFFAGFGLLASGWQHAISHWCPWN